MAATTKVDAAVLKAWAMKRAAAAKALNLTDEQIANIGNITEDEAIAILLYKRNKAAEEE